jgi:hypothetical protein
MTEPSAFSVVKSGKTSQIALTILLDEDLKDIYLAKAEDEGKDLDSVINAGLRRAVRNDRGDKYGLSDEEIAKISRNDNDARFFVFHRSILRGLAEHAELFPSLPPCAPFIKDLQGSIEDFAEICKEDTLHQEKMAKAREAEQESKEQLLEKVNSVIEYHRKLHELGLIPQDLGPPPVMAPIPRIPSAPLFLRAENAPDAHVQLTWAPPVGGTRVLSYEIERAKVPCGPGIPWTLAVTSLFPKVLLPETLGDVLLYQVVAVGADGRGEPSDKVCIEVE